MTAADSALDFQGVDILFCKPGNRGRKTLRDALSALDAGGTRAEKIGRAHV